MRCLRIGRSATFCTLRVANRFAGHPMPAYESSVIRGSCGPVCHSVARRLHCRAMTARRRVTADARAQRREGIGPERTAEQGARRDVQREEAPIGNLSPDSTDVFLKSILRHKQIEWRDRDHSRPLGRWLLPSRRAIHSRQFQPDGAHWAISHAASRRPGPDRRHSSASHADHPVLSDNPTSSWAMSSRAERRISRHCPSQRSSRCATHNSERQRSERRICAVGQGDGSLRGHSDLLVLCA